MPSFSSSSFEENTTTTHRPYEAYANAFNSNDDGIEIISPIEKEKRNDDSRNNDIRIIKSTPFPTGKKVSNHDDDDGEIHSNENKSKEYCLSSGNENKRYFSRFK